MHNSASELPRIPIPRRLVNNVGCSRSDLNGGQWCRQMTTSSMDSLSLPREG
jgi:hypothetical protein